MLKQIICFYTFLACCSFNLASAQTAPKNPNTFTLQEVIDRPTVSWTSPLSEGWGDVELTAPIQIATPKFVKGKKIYIAKGKLLDIAAFQKMRFLSGLKITFDPETFVETVNAEFVMQPGFAKIFDIEGQFFYDKVQNAVGFVADKIYLKSNLVEGVYIENAIINYNKRPKHLTPISLVHGAYTVHGTHIPFKTEHAIAARQLEPLKKSIANIPDAEIQQYGDVSPIHFKCELYWDETIQQFGLFVETFNFQMRHKDKFVTDYEFTKPAAH